MRWPWRRERDQETAPERPDSPQVVRSGDADLPTRAELTALLEEEGGHNAVFRLTDALIRQMGDRSDADSVDFIRSQSPGLKMIWGLFSLEGEVNNGGFTQFFWNSSRHYLPEVREGCILIGAHEHLGLFEEALAVYEEHRGRLGALKDENSLEAFSTSYEPDVFHELDNRFFELDSMPLQLAYIRQHLDEFCQDAAP